MTATNNHGHPELETLLAFADGSQDEFVAAHLKRCALCRLEIQRYQQFEVAENPDAEWDRAELQLARSWQEEIKPQVKTASPSRWAWLVPAAAAAVAAFFFLQPAAPPEPGPVVVRGAGEIAAPEITLDAPSGDIEAPPAQFVWQTEQECDTYTLEIFTADLELVFRQEEIPQPAWVSTKELQSLLQPETIYLWTVAGFRDLRQVAESANGWFMLTP